MAAAHVSPTAGVLEARDATTCVLRIGARTIADLAVYLQETDLDMTVEEPDELRDHLRGLAARLVRAAGADPTA